MSPFEFVPPDKRPCPRCGGAALLTIYKPVPGLDPAQREYKCTVCKYVHYYTPVRPQLKRVAPNRFH